MPYISQGSVATRFRCGGIFNDDFTVESRDVRRLNIRSAFVKLNGVTTTTEAPNVGGVC